MRVCAYVMVITVFICLRFFFPSPGLVFTSPGLVFTSPGLVFSIPGLIVIKRFRKYYNSYTRQTLSPHHPGSEAILI